MRVAMYLRVSTDDQTTENQRREIEQAIAQRGWTVVGIYEDLGISGSKGRLDRPQFDRLHQDAIRGAFDVVAAWSVDRLGRSLQDLVAFLGVLDGVHVSLYLHRQAVDTTTSQGRMLFQLLSVFAEFERSIIVERVKAGQARAKAAGKRIGGSNPIPDVIRRRVAALKQAGWAERRIARECGISAPSVSRILAALPILQ